MQVKDYLFRIGIKTLPLPSLQALLCLQDAHMRHVPFENLDVLLGRRLNLSINALFDKIVTRQRGGYCFELNSLYGALLTEIGFEPVPMMARVWLRDPVDIPPRTHLVNRVKIEGKDWISDVGFGGRAARVPLLIEDGYEVDDGDGRIRICKDPQFGYRISRFQDGVWSGQYTVETQAAIKADILSGNHWTENHPDSHFRHGIGIGLFTKEGRTSFYDGVLTHRGQKTRSRKIIGLNTTLDVLKTEFGLAPSLSSQEQERLAQILS